jgi:hypothetical protein
MAQAFCHLLSSPGTRWIEGWVRLRDGLDDVTKKKISALTGNRVPVVQPIALSLH